MIVMEHVAVDRRSQFPWCSDLIDVDPADPAANAQFLVIQKFDHRLAVDTRSVNAQQFALAFYRDCGIFLVHQVRGFEGVAWFVILHLF